MRSFIGRFDRIRLDGDDWKVEVIDGGIQYTSTTKTKIDIECSGYDTLTRLCKENSVLYCFGDIVHAHFE